MLGRDHDDGAAMMRVTARLLGRSAAVAALLLLIGAGAAILMLGMPAKADRYMVVDGDTLELVPHHCVFSALHLGCPVHRLRLYGVDAFESKQKCRDGEGRLWPCGVEATKRLRALVEGPNFRCTVDTEFRDRHAREFALCTAGGQDVGALLIQEGVAFAYGRGAQYLPLELEAKEKRRGAWAGGFVRPQYFRQGATE
jgi:endonuclease YncB( thermonuclease family)